MFIHIMFSIGGYWLELEYFKHIEWIFFKQDKSVVLYWMIRGWEIMELDKYVYKHIVRFMPKAMSVYKHGDYIQERK